MCFFFPSVGVGFEIKRSQVQILLRVVIPRPKSRSTVQLGKDKTKSKTDLYYKKPENSFEIATEIATLLTEYHTSVADNLYT